MAQSTKEFNQKVFPPRIQVLRVVIVSLSLIYVFTAADMSLKESEKVIAKGGYWRHKRDPGQQVIFLQGVQVVNSAVVIY